MAFNKNKKAQMEYIVPIAVVLAAGIILFMVYGPLLLAGRAATDTETCRLSVLAKAKTSIAGTESPVFDLECKTDFIIVYNDRIEKNSKVMQKLDSKTAESQVKRMIANEMYDCWYQMGAGEVEALPLFAGLDVSRQCIICAYIDFDESFSKDHPVLENFYSSYLQKNVPGKDISYWDYLKYGDYPEITDFLKGVKITTNEGYAVSFAAIRTAQTSQTSCLLLVPVLSPLASVCALERFRSMENKFITIVSPTEKIGEACQIMH